MREQLEEARTGLRSDQDDARRVALAKEEGRAALQQLKGEMVARDRQWRAAHDAAVAEAEEAALTIRALEQELEWAKVQAEQSIKEAEDAREDATLVIIRPSLVMIPCPMPRARACTLIVSLATVFPGPHRAGG